MKFVWPVDGRLTDRYGWRAAIPGVAPAQFHSGDDIAAPTGTPIRAAAAGVVARKWWDTFANGTGAGGNMVAIDHGDGWETRYAHMQSQSPLAVGSRVDTSTVVGLVGSSGAATGAHLHYEVLHRGQFLNPSEYTGNATPPPQPKPQPKKKRKHKMDYASVCYLMPNKVYLVKIFCLGNGEEHHYEVDQLEYINNVAKTYQCGPNSIITKSHYDSISRATAATRARLDTRK